jgi:hypothetical protein
MSETYKWSKATAWHGIARLLLTCDRWNSGWVPFHDVVVYREVNDFPRNPVAASNAVLDRARSLTNFLADELEIDRRNICSQIGLYWKDPVVSGKQPHNLVGHAFRSLAVEILQTFGDPGVTYEEEVRPSDEFPGFEFRTRSEKAKVDIVARRGRRTVALISSRWRFRHDRVDVHEEALAYISAARRHNPNIELFAYVGEFAPNRLKKILDSSEPAPNAPLTAAVHFAPQLITKGLGENGRLSHLKSLEWLIDRTWTWK